MRRWPSWRGETTLRSSHHCNWRRLTPEIRATSVLVYTSDSGSVAGRSFFVLNISQRFRFQLYRHFGFYCSDSPCQDLIFRVTPAVRVHAKIKLSNPEVFVARI